MPKTKFQRVIFAFITVVITVHAYVFYSLYVVNGAALMSAAGENRVLQAKTLWAECICAGGMCPSGRWC